VEKLTGTAPVEKTAKRKEKKEERESPLEYFVKAGTTFIPAKKKRAYPYLKRENPRQFIKADETRQFPIPPSLNPKLLKEYIVMSARYFSKTPPEKIPEITLRLEEIEKDLRSQGLPAPTLDHLKEKTLNMVKIELADLIREKLTAEMAHPQNLLQTILSSQLSIKLLSFMFYNEALPPIPVPIHPAESAFEKVLKEIINHTLPAEVKELEAILTFVHELGIDLQPWINRWNFDKIIVGENGQVSLAADLTPMEREKKLFLEEIKMLESRKYLEPDLWRRILIYYRIRQAEKILRALEVSKDEINAVRTLGRQIAWIKLMAVIKEFHLKRVFCGSPNEFNELSETINYLTRKARKLESRLQQEETRLLHAGLEKLALDTANYKLELLKSLQEIDPSEQNTKDIKWLSAVIQHIQARQKQMEALEEFKHSVQATYAKTSGLLGKFLKRPS
jgi:hypothetical protein